MAPEFERGLEWTRVNNEPRTRLTNGGESADIF
jgi:hypothetical protein